MVNLAITKLVAQLARESYSWEMLKVDSLDRIPNFVGDGLFRITAKHLGVAFKFARCESYARYNRTEWKLWSGANAALRAKLAKPLAISACGKVIAFEFLPRTIKSLYNATDDFEVQLDLLLRLGKFNEDLIGLLVENGWTMEDAKRQTSDNHGGNIAQRDDGSLVWIDYASC